MNVAMVLAGGVGQRMGADVPKQFIEVNDKPIIFYPLKILEDCDLVDAVEIVCVADYIDQMREITQKYEFKKVQWIVAGGENGQKSMYNGLNHLKGKVHDDDILLVHMTSYPLVSEEVIRNCIASAVKNGNGITARPIRYSLFESKDQRTGSQALDRTKYMMSTIPLAFRFGECMALFDRAYREKCCIDDHSFAPHIYCAYEKPLFFTEDSDLNIKVTTPEDITLMKAILLLSEDQQ